MEYHISVIIKISQIHSRSKEAQGVLRSLTNPMALLQIMRFGWSHPSIRDGNL
jgi:hypothetical protein